MYLTVIVFLLFFIGNGAASTPGKGVFANSDEEHSLLGRNVMAILEDNLGGLPEDPFFIFNLNEIYDRIRMWKQHFPNIRAHYAVKANMNPRLLKIMVEEGSAFDCASEKEFNTMIKLGAKAEDIVFSQTNKYVSHLHSARQHGIKQMTFDTPAELGKIKTHYPDAELLLRIKAYPEGTTYCLHPLGNKFGVNYEVAKELLTKAVKEMGLNVVGVHFHIGSGCNDTHVFNTAIETSSILFRFARDRLGWDNMTVLDIGGGFTTQYTSFDETARIVNTAIEWHFRNFPNLTVIAEPGRFFAESAFWLTTQVVNVKKDDFENVISYYINDGTYGGFSSVAGRKRALPEPKVLKLKKKPQEQQPSLHYWKRTIIFGITCDSDDTLPTPPNYKLPSELDVGDYLIFPHLGAYSLEMGTGFNGYGPPDVFYFR